MTSRQQLHQKMKALEDNLQKTIEKSQEYTARAEDIRNYLEHLKQEKSFIDKGLDQPLDKIDSPFESARKRPGKTNVQVYEEILTLYGRPMHATDILDSAIKLGVEFKNDGEPRTQLRNALNGAKKRFTNIGNNTWWIAGHPVPGEEDRDTLL